MEQLLSACGLIVILGIAWALSTDRRNINWRVVIGGTALQLVFALIILRTAAGRMVFDQVGAAVTHFLDLADRGSIFIFGENFRDHFIAFKVLPTIIFFSSFITVLYYLGIMQWVVRAFAWVMMRVLRTSGAESLSAAASMTFAHGRSASMRTVPAVRLCSVSGSISLAITRAAGADITLAASRWPAMSGQRAESMPT